MSNGQIIRPSRRHAWVGVLIATILGIIWSAVSLGQLKIAGQDPLLVFFLWLIIITFLIYISVKVSSDYSVILSLDGVEWGAFSKKYIAWSDARIKYNSGSVEICSNKNKLVLNTYVFKNRAKLYELIMSRTTLTELS